ncbi:GDNF family receptor alpha-like [Pleurodeles waltl]|uniref:GDNF family receptor alpha-like n=1 Tax=Pleurodeles waltl TaxID=8319 RepID=UPI003709BDA3
MSFLIGETCQMKDSSRCNVAIKYLADTYPNFKDCFCMESFDCDIKRSLVESCFRNKGTASSPMVEWEAFKVVIRGAMMGAMTGAQAVILTELKQVKDRFGPLEREAVLQTPQAQMLQDARAEHAELLERLRKVDYTTYKEWAHSDGALDQVQLSSFLSDIILPALNDTAKEILGAQITKGEIHKAIKDMAQDTNIRSCFEVTTMCISDPQCNRKLASQLADCSKEEGRSCNRTKCLASIRSFYDSMPFNVAQLFALCDCAEADTPCQEASRAFHSKPCAVYRYPVPSCLQKIQRCLADAMCRKRYEAFQSKCWGNSAICHGDEICLSGVSRLHHTCSGDDDCKAAYINTLGTILQEQCTCSNVSESEQHLCKMIHYMLQRKACFGVKLF